MAREQSLGKANGKFSRAVNAVLGLLQGYVPDATALGSIDADTRRTLLRLTERLATQGAVSDSLLTSARQAFTAPEKAVKRLREWVAAHKGMESHALREELNVELTNAEATGAKHTKYWCRLHTLQLLLDGRAVDLAGYGRKALAHFEAVVDAQVAQGALSPEALSAIKDAERNRGELVAYLKTAKIPKPK
jgi:hypothetical protein